MKFIYYPPCSTCKKAKAWLEDHALPFEGRDIKLENPSLEELTRWVSISGLPIKKFFNTSGLKYKELNLKDRLPAMSQQEQLELLASDGMLVKRPIVIKENLVLVGFKPLDWEKNLL